MRIFHIRISYFVFIFVEIISKMRNQPKVFNPSDYKIEAGTHHKRSVLFFGFPNDTTLKENLKKALPVKWSSTNKKWYALDTSQHRIKMGLAPRPTGESAVAQLSSENKSAYLKMREELILRGYSVNTQRVYLSEFIQFLAILRSHPVDSLTVVRLRSYLMYCAEKLELKESTIHSRMNAIKFYYELVLKVPNFFLEIPRPKKRSSLPKVISQKDIKKMFDLTTNIKHRVALQLVYGMGLRVSEIVNLKISDIDSSRKMVLIESAKGKKDRYVPLPESILDELRKYCIEYKPTKYLFEGGTGGQYTIRAAQAVFKQAMNRAKINKPIGIHGLRHSYATHLLEAGTDTSFIKELLGHSEIKTTMIYTHVSNQNIAQVKSPLDNI